MCTTHTHTQDLLNIARTTLSSKLLTQHKDHFAELAVEAVLRLKGSGNLEAIQVIRKLGGNLRDSYLEEGGCRGNSFMVVFHVCVFHCYKTPASKSMCVVITVVRVLACQAKEMNPTI